MENWRNRIHIKPVKSNDIETLYKLQIKSTFTGFKFYGSFDCLAFKNQTVTFRKQINLGYCVLEFTKLYV